jgi:hypothetical protein
VPRATIYQNVTEGIIPDLNVNRYDHGASRDHGQAGRDPLRTIPAHDGHVVPTLHTDPAQTMRERPYPPGELAIRPTLYSFLTKGHESRPPTKGREPVDHGPQRLHPASYPQLHITHQLYPYVVSLHCKYRGPKSWLSRLVERISGRRGRAMWPNGLSGTMIRA